MLDSFYPNVWYNGKEFNATEGEVGQILHYNSLIGSIRLRQVRSKQAKCEVPAQFEKHFSMCHTEYTLRTHETGSYGPGVEDSSVLFTLGPDKGKPAVFKHQTMADLKGSTAIVGWSLYGGGGYVMDLPSPRTPLNLLSNVNHTLREEAAAYLADLKRLRWIDRDTRAVFIDFNLFNANNNMFQVNRMVVEFPVSGGTIMHSFIRAVKLFRYETLFEKVILGFELVFVGLVCYYLLIEFSKMYREGLCFYFVHGLRRDMWRVLDITNLLLFAACIGSRIFTMIRMSSMDANPNRLEYTDLQFLARITINEKNFNSFNGMLCWLKSLKYLSIQARIAMYTWTLSDAKRDISLTMVTLVIMYIGFTQGFYILFNTDLPEFRSMGSTLFNLLCMMFGDFDFVSMYRINSTAVLLFLIFMILMFLTVVNIFIAIINSSYDRGIDKANSDDPSERFRDIFGVILVKVLNKFRCVRLVLLMVI